VTNRSKGAFNRKKEEQSQNGKTVGGGKKLRGKGGRTTRHTTPKDTASGRKKIPTQTLQKGAVSRTETWVVVVDPEHRREESHL